MSASLTSSLGDQSTTKPIPLDTKPAAPTKPTKKHYSPVSLSLSSDDEDDQDNDRLSSSSSSSSNSSSSSSSGDSSDDGRAAARRERRERERAKKEQKRVQKRARREQERQRRGEKARERLKQVEQVLEAMVEEGVAKRGSEFWGQGDGSGSEYEAVVDRIDEYTKRKTVPTMQTIGMLMKGAQKMYYREKTVRVPQQQSSRDPGDAIYKAWAEVSTTEAEREQMVLEAGLVPTGSNMSQLFNQMYKEGFFTKLNQKKLECERQLKLLKRRDEVEANLKDIEQKLKNLPSNETDELSTGPSDPALSQPDKLIDALIFDSTSSQDQDRASSQEFFENQLVGFNDFRNSEDSDRTVSYISDMETDNPKSEYNKLRRRDIKELAKQFAKDAIKRHNKKQLQAFTFTTDTRQSGRLRQSIQDVIDDDFDLTWIQSTERFKNCARARQTLTIPSFHPKDPAVEDYKRQETERYKNPLDPWVYYIHDGRTSIVGPVYRKKAQIQSKPREHLFLRSERPAAANILAIVRDAASKLPDYVGTRSDVSELCKWSQYLSDNLTDFYISQTVSGGLDRLSAEEDPCVRYDQTNKLWIYLHGRRKIDSHKWVSGLNCSSRMTSQIDKSGGMEKSSTKKSFSTNDTTDMGSANRFSQDQE